MVGRFFREIFFKDMLLPIIIKKPEWIGAAGI
jgi:hypothetical protein